jgi:hypothetical protein
MRARAQNPIGSVTVGRSTGALLPADGAASFDDPQPTASSTARTIFMSLSTTSTRRYFLAAKMCLRATSQMATTPRWRILRSTEIA